MQDIERLYPESSASILLSMLSLYMYLVLFITFFSFLFVDVY